MANEPDMSRLLNAHKNLKTNPEYALSELRTLAELGSTSAPIYLGWTYQYGEGVEKDLQMAEYWFKKSIAGGERMASYFLGKLYCIEQRYEEANSAFELSSNLGYFPATYCLAMNIKEGKGRTKDIDVAVNLLKSSAKHGHLFSNRALASIYLSGRFGLWKALYGIFLILKSLPRLITIAINDIEDDRLRS
jgi:TPR repeat protein